MVPMLMHLTTAAVAVALAGAALGQDEPTSGVVDAFHPDRALEASAPEPRHGGRVIVHLESRPESFNGLIDSGAVERRVLGELHAFLLRRDPLTWEHRGELARTWTVDDTLVLADGTRLHGRVERRADGWRITPLDEAPARELGADEVASHEAGTVFTLQLRDDARWHDGHPFDADDVRFSWRMTRNPHVHCDARRFEFEKITEVEVLGPHAVRVIFGQRNYLAPAVLDGLVILPRHLYDLSDPDNAEHRAEFSEEEQGRFVNEHPANQAWVGLGPYRLADHGDGWFEAERVEDWFDPARGGWLDRIRWRVLEPAQAVQALANGELDFSALLSSADYFGEQVRAPEFSARFYTGYIYTPRMSYVVWNTSREELASPAVRTALGLCFDWDAFIRSQYRGLARRVTSERAVESAGYDRDLAPLPHDPRRARKLLLAEGWYDRDGDGVVDKDGVPLELELLVPGNSASARLFGAKLAEDLAAIGVRLEVAAREWAVFNEQLFAREFDGANLAWNMPVESDPEQLWHSRWVGEGTGNHASWADARTDELIEAVQVELDGARRAQLLRELQAHIHAAQPYMFGVSVPYRFAMSRRVRGVATTAIQPGYTIRDWFVVE